MKYRNFITKVLCFILVFAAFVPYQAKAARKAEEEAENAAKIAEVEAANREVRKQMADAENASPYTDGVYEGTAGRSVCWMYPEKTLHISCRLNRFWIRCCRHREWT